MGYSKDSYSRGDNLIYSQSSAFQGSNKLSYSKNTLGDIKLVESNHFKEPIKNKRFVKQQFFGASNIIEDLNEKTSIESPYRKLTSQINSEGKSLTSVKYLDIEPIVNRQNRELIHSDILEQYGESNNKISFQYVNVNEFENRYFSQ